MKKFLFYFDLDTGGLIIGYLYFSLSGLLCIFSGGAAINDKLNNKFLTVVPLIFLIIAITSYLLIDGTVSVSIPEFEALHNR